MSECQAQTKSGQPCPSHALPGSNFCFTHSPDHAQERVQASRRGGLNRRRHLDHRPFPAPDVTTAAGLITFNDALLHAAWDNSLPANRLRALCALVQTQVRLLEVGNFERRLLEIERIHQSRLENAAREHPPKPKRQTLHPSSHGSHY